MNIKIFRSLSESSIERKVNHFLETNQTIEVIDIKFSISVFDYAVMILFKES